MRQRFVDLGLCWLSAPGTQEAYVVQKGAKKRKEVNYGSLSVEEKVEFDKACFEVEWPSIVGNHSVKVVFLAKAGAMRREPKLRKISVTASF